MSFPTIHPENKAINLLDSAVTLIPDLRPELVAWVRQLNGTIARPVPRPDALNDLVEATAPDDIDLDYETCRLATALCRYRERVYPNGLPIPEDPNGDARDDLESAISRLEERLARAKPKVELDNAPDAGDYATEGPDTDRAD